MSEGARLDALEARVAAAEKRLAALEGGGGTRAAAVAPAPAQGAAAVASDSMLDEARWGDQIVKKDPPRWEGESFEGRRWSQCPPEYLDELAGFHEWCATREELEPAKAKYAVYSRERAAKCRGWARRMRLQGVGAGTFAGGDPEIPF